MDYAPHKDAVDSLVTLHAKGVKDHEIVSLKNIIERSGVSNIKELEDDIKSYGSLKSAINELENQNKELVTRNLALKNQNELLECEQTSLKKTVEDMGDFFKAEFDKYNNTIKAGTESIKSTIAESDKAMEHSTAELKRGTDDARIQILKVLEAAKIGYQKIQENQRLLVYEPLVLAQRGEKVEGEGIVVALISAIESGEPHLNSMTHDSAKWKLRKARDELAESLEYFPSLV
jgi:gas vesicle protein